MLAYEMVVDTIDENLQVSENSSVKALRELCKIILKNVGPKYLVEWNELGLREIISRIAIRGLFSWVGNTGCHNLRI